MILVASSEIAGKKIAKTIGLVKGNTIRAHHLGKDIIAGLKNPIFVVQALCHLQT